MKNPFAGLFRARDKPKDSVSAAPTFFFGMSGSGKPVNAQTAIQLSAVYACVRVISETVASLPLGVYEATDDGSQKATDHSLYFLLHDEPNSEMTSFVLREVMLAHLLLYGNSYCQILRSGRNQITGLYPLLPDHPPVEELKKLVTSLFMSGFVKLGKIFDLNRSFDMWLIDKVFQGVGKRDRKLYAQHPVCFCNVSEPYDKKKRAARYHFTQCPNAEFAKKHDLMQVLPLFCNSDYWGISQIHGTLIRCGTCGNSDKCDYCVVGSENPMAKEYEIVKDEAGFLVSKKKKYM